MNLLNTKRACPVCEASTAEFLHHQKFLLPEDHPLPDHYDVVICEKCQFAFADTSGTEADYSRYYADYSKYADQQTSTGGGGSATDLFRLESAAARIADLAQSPNAKIVDIGCANGGLLGCLKKRGFNNLLGVDPSDACVSNTQELFGIPARQGWLLGLPEEANDADVAIVSHVMEHLLDLKSAVAKLRGVLAPGGLVYVEVPDAQRYVECLSAPFQDFNTEHINHFSAASLENLFSSSGFSSVEIGTRTLEAAAGVPYPVLYGFFRKSEEVSGRDGWRIDQEFKESMQRYVRNSQEQFLAIDKKVAPYLSEPLIIWGTGQLTLKLLAETSLAEADIAAFVDGNPVNHGKKLLGKEIVSPEHLVSLPQHPIVVGTLIHHKAIAKRIAEMGLRNFVVTFEKSV